MTVRGASLPGGDPPGQDRWATTDRGIIVLDGATAFDPDAPPADRYVDALMGVMTETLDSEAMLSLVLCDAIAVVTYQLQLEAGAGPSSTALLLRENRDRVEIAVLGDSTAMIGFRDGTTERLTDDRIKHIAPELRARYRDRLAAGCGYDDTHHSLLLEIQQAERAARNTEDGYPIAEADKMAGHAAVVRHYLSDEIAWCVLATDGAQRGLDHQGIDWATLPGMTAHELHGLLDELQRWETEQDPDGHLLPRAKRHDDKTIVTWENTTP